MKSKLLKTLRKYFEYKFLKNGNVAVRNKRTGVTKVYDSIEDYVRSVSYTDTFISSIFSHKWNKKKLSIKDSKIVKDNEYWNLI